MAAGPRLEIRRRPTFGFAAFDKGGQFLLHCDVHRRGFETGDNFLEQPMRSFGGPSPACNFPSLKIAPIADDGLIERLRIAVLGMLNAKVMPRWPDFLKMALTRCPMVEQRW